MPDAPPARWRIPPCQRFVCEEFDDRVVMFDALVGSTHLLNVTAAEALAIVAESPGLDTPAVHRELLARLGLDADALPQPAVEELLWRLEDLNLVGVDPQ